MKEMEMASLILTYKLMILITYFMFGACFYKLVSSHFDKVPSLFITCCVMLQREIYYDEILAGMWNQYLALGLFFIFFHILEKNIDTLKTRVALILGVLLGTIILIHLWVGIMAFLLLFIYGVSKCARFS